MLKLTDALERVLTRETTTGTPIECELIVPIEGLTAGTALSVESLRDRVKSVHAGESTQEIFSVSRTMKNWQIMRGPTPVIRSHPWDDSPNVAVLSSRSGVGLDRAIGQSVVEDTEALATRCERLKLISEALVMRRTALSLRLRFGLPIESARDEAERLQKVLVALQAAPPAPSGSAS